MYEYLARLDRVIDGDTVDLTVDLGFSVFHRVRVRVLGVDTPERGEDGWAEATQFVKDWFWSHSAVLFVQTVKDKDKYGRILANISAEPVVARAGGPVRDTLSQALLDAGLASPYAGGARG